MPHHDPSDLRVSHVEPGRVDLTSANLFADPASPFCRRFVAGLFSVAEVESLVIDRPVARITYATGGTEIPRLMRRIAAALREPRDMDDAVGPLDLSPPARGPLTVRRYGAVVSTWEVRHALAGRCRLAHPKLRRHRWRSDAVVAEVAATPGVRDCRVRLSTGSLVVLYDPDRIGLDAVLRRCEAALARPEARDAERPSLARFGVGTALLALAFAGAHVSPPLLVACALLLVAMNVDTFRRALRSLRGGRLDVDVAYSTLIALALILGDFPSIALTAWCVRAWPLLLDRRLAATRRALLPGEAAAVDGEMRRRLIDATRVTADDGRPGHRVADRAAPPVLAFAALGGFTGSLGASAAVLSPNYFAAPGFDPLYRNSALLISAGAGCLVRADDALPRLAAARAVVVDVPLDDARAGVLVSGLRARGIDTVVRLAPEHGAAERLRALDRLRRQGVPAILVGRGDDPAAATRADVTVALAAPGRAADAADIVIPGPRLDAMLALIDVARAHVRDIRLSRHLGLWPNVLAVGGAVLAGTPGLVSSVLTNLGALAVYWRGSGRLGRAEAAWRAGTDPARSAV